jgi:hypothetical protein
MVMFDMSYPVALILQKPDSHRREVAFRVEKYGSELTALQCVLPDALVHSAVRPEMRWRLNPRNNIKSNRQLHYHMATVVTEMGDLDEKPSEHLALETVYDDKMTIVGQGFRFITASARTVDYGDIIEFQGKKNGLSVWQPKELLNHVAREFYKLHEFSEAAQGEALTLCIGDPSPPGLIKSLRIESNRGLRSYFRENDVTGFAVIPDDIHDEKEWDLRTVAPTDEESLICGMRHTRVPFEHLNICQAIFYGLGMGRPYARNPEKLVEQINSHNARMDELRLQEEKAVPLQQAPAPV